MDSEYFSANVYKCCPGIPGHVGEAFVRYSAHRRFLGRSIGVLVCRILPFISYPNTTFVNSSIILSCAVL